MPIDQIARKYSQLFLLPMYYNSFISVHAAIIAINQTIENGDPAATLAALQNPNAHLINVHVENENYYQEQLLVAKQTKRASVDLDVSAFF